jgi:hypothetical protein
MFNIREFAVTGVIAVDVTLLADELVLDVGVTSNAVVVSMPLHTISWASWSVPVLVIVTLVGSDADALLYQILLENPLLPTALYVSAVHPDGVPDTAPYFF